MSNVEDDYVLVVGVSESSRCGVWGPKDGNNLSLKSSKISTNLNLFYSYVIHCFYWDIKLK